LAAAATHPVFRTIATVASAVLALLVSPTGADFLFRAWVVPTAILAAAITLVVPLLLVRGRTPALSAVLRTGSPPSATMQAGASGYRSAT
jgi:alpha-1,6-mannosyltransferase